MYLNRYSIGDGVGDADLLGGDADRMGEAARLAGEGEREGVPFLLFLLQHCEMVNDDEGSKERLTDHSQHPPRSTLKHKTENPNSTTTTKTPQRPKEMVHQVQ